MRSYWIRLLICFTGILIILYLWYEASYPVKNGINHLSLKAAVSTSQNRSSTQESISSSIAVSSSEIPAQVATGLSKSRYKNASHEDVASSNAVSNAETASQITTRSNITLNLLFSKTLQSVVQNTSSHSQLAQVSDKQDNAALNKSDNNEKPYVDQTIGGNLSPAILFGDSEDENYDHTGLPHYLRIEAVSSITKNSGSTNSQENGFAINSQFETQNFGAFSINGVLRTEPGGMAGSIIQRGLPFDGGWVANNGIGTLYTPSIDLARNQYRFYIPTFPALGASTEWLHKGDLQLQFSSGEPGVFDGLKLNGFSQLGGSVTTGGAQWNISPQLQIGAQIVNTQHVSTFSGSSSSFNQFFGLTPNAENTKTSGQSFYGTAAWQNIDTKIQGNLLQSQNNLGPDATGLWIDAKTRLGPVTQNAGFFRLGPNLSWGYTPISNNLEGVYYRANYNSRQWLMDGGFDAVKSVSGNASDGVLFTGSLRYQVNHALGLGGSATYRHSEQDAESGYLFMDLINKYGTGRAQLDGSSENGDQFTRLTLSQGWGLSAGSRLSTSIYGEVENNAGQHINHIGASLNGGSDLFNNISWNGNLSYDKSMGAGSNQTISANVDLTARINSHWSLISSYLENQNTSTNPFNIQPLIPVPVNTVVSTGTAFFVTLRYETRGGTPLVPLGGTSGGAAGSISGYLFLDANDNGIPDANEEPAQNVTILLDGKFSTRTNSLGRFEFPLVATGRHIITVVPDNLPLPWLVSDSGKRTVNVNTRETNYIDIPASRLK